MARRTNTAERRQQIADALKRVMAREGFEGATIASIAREAELTPGLVHYHFKNKLAILLMVISELQESHGALLRAQVDAAGEDADAQLTAYLDLHLATGSTADPSTVAFWVLAGGEALRSEAVREVYAEALSANTAILREIVATGVASGRFTCADQESAVAALTALIQGYYSVAATARALIPRNSAAPAARAVADALLGVDRSG